MKFWALVNLLLGLVLITPGTQAQIVSLPIPGSPLTLNVLANPQPLQNIYNDPNAVSHNISDDGSANVLLPFSFPFYGKNFTESTMYSNGGVQFGRLVPPGGSATWNSNLCCSGVRLNSSTPEGYYNSIFILQTDLIAEPGSHYSLGTPNTMTYGWYNVNQYNRPNNKSSFELKIDSGGGIDMRWSGALVTTTPVSIGTVGDASLGQFTQNYYGEGINIGPTQLNTGVVSECVFNTLYSPSCPGYAEAYKTLQCSLSPLYDPTCPGYNQAYFTQQCNLNSLYNPACPGYDQANFLQQCVSNPLFNAQCPGYQEAYFTQQCSLSALYSPSCPGYSDAFLAFNCSQNSLYSPSCPGYQEAYFAQQCSLNPLYNSGCPGYAAAYQAYQVTQACTANSQSSPSCSGYVAPETTTAPTAAEVAVASNTSTTTVTPTVVANPIVNRVVTSTSTSTSAAQPAAPVQLVAPSNATQTTTALVVEAVQSQNTASSSNTNNQSASSTSSNTSSSSTTTAAPTARQSIQQARVEAARKQAVARGAEAIKESGEAKSMDAQVATQGLVVAAMGFNPAFDAYNNVTIKDAQFYKPFTIYSGQTTVDNRAASRSLFGSTDRLHNEMVNQQYQLGK